MSYIYVCNTSSDCISKVNVEEFREESKITLNTGLSDRIGPHGICEYHDKIITANSYSNNISVIDTKQGREESKHFIGMHCNDVIVYDNNAYIICGESNNVVVFDLIKNKISEEIPCGNLPHSIAINKETGILVVSNMENDSITLIDCHNKDETKSIKVGSYPTKAIFTVDNKYILVCESNIGSDYRGSIGIISMKNFKMIYRIPVGNCPVDMVCDERYCFVSNFGEGFISVVDINYYEVMKKINIGGMPRGIIKYNQFVFVGDNYNNLLMKVNIFSEDKKIIPIGGEPTGMILSNY